MSGSHNPLPSVADAGALRRLLHIVSPALPIGSYAYSQAMEPMFDAGRLRDEDAVGDWLGGLLDEVHSRVDIPILARLYGAFSAHDEAAAGYWNDCLVACRETAELRREETDRGRALASLIGELGWLAGRHLPQRPTVVSGFAFAAVHGGVALHDAAVGYSWCWLENQVVVATKLIPLGQMAGQRLLEQLSPRIDTSVAHGLSVADDEIGCSPMGLAIASARHEKQYTRLFRS